MKDSMSEVSLCHPSHHVFLEGVMCIDCIFGIPWTLSLKFTRNKYTGTYSYSGRQHVEACGDVLAHNDDPMLFK